MKNYWSSLKASLQKAGKAFTAQIRLKFSNRRNRQGAPNASRAIDAIKGIRLNNLFKSVGTKLFIIFLLSIWFFVLSVGFISYFISKDVIQRKVAEASEQTIVQAGQKLDILYNTYEDLSMQILIDEDLRNVLKELNQLDKNSYEYLVLRQKLGERLNVYSYSNKAITSIQLMNSAGDPLAGSGGTLKSEGLGQESWFKSILDNNGAVSWLGTKQGGFSQNVGVPGAASFALGRLLKVTNDYHVVLLMEINLDVIDKELSSINMGEGGRTIIAGPNMELIYHADRTTIGNDSNLDVAKESFENDMGRLLSDNKNMQLVYYKSQKNHWLLVGEMPVDELVKDAKTISNMTWLMTAVAAVIAVIIGYFIAQMIGRPIIMLRNLMKQGEQGDLRVRMTVKRNDEIGQLGESFNQMMEKITGLVQQTNQSAQDVLNTAGELSEASKQTAISAKEIAVATEEIANGASSLAAESERGNELTHNIGLQMKNVVDANIVMGSSASEVQKSSKQGIEYMSQLIGKTNTTEAMTREMVEKVDNLKDSTSSIRKILEMLNSITKQTNILSLNATIEAARAGAAGKGFMVVADEIRKLADQSRQSIAVVGEITEKIQKEIDETVSVLSQAYPIFQEQIQSVKEADSIFKQVDSQMGGLIDRLSEVTESISQLESSQMILNDAMTNVSAVAQQSSATSEEVASLSSEQLNISSSLVKLSDKLEELSNSLKESLSKFQV
ncbi:methyl-accepting chemotaxis protein [Paenibacillus naphthalenovorans]|uniref:methyl-accepting chemotaxis protein n=1 Tax=Paenibacillus naphthalenovorans TaxID=162209 RepID=UPI0008833904|nr:methyl-accepting chemotaxis protein [Paenibacillus naphthalenovorans]SDI14158.1 methyl-accepting chemotaxis protein [Paenibacillus naphthalenovorans]